MKGLEALKEHFKNSKFPCEMDHYLPVVFSPPRDGRQLSEPLPIVGHQNSYEMDGQDRVEDDDDEDDAESEVSSESEQRQLLLLLGDSSTGCSTQNGGVGGDCCCDDEDTAR